MEIEYYLVLESFHDYNKICSITYNNIDNNYYFIYSYYFKNCSYFNKSKKYTKYEILNIFYENYKFNMTSNPTHRRYNFYINEKKNNKINTIFVMDTELYGGVSSFNEVDFKWQFRKCFDFALDLIKEINTVPQTLEYLDSTFICNISGAQCDIDISILNNNNNNKFRCNKYYIIKNNDKNNSILCFKNRDILESYICNQIRFARYLKTTNTNKDYYPIYGHDSEKLIQDCFKLLI